MNAADCASRYWNVVIKNGGRNVAKGIHANPEISVPSDILAVANGQLDPAKAFMQGKAQVKGNLTDTIQLIQLFRLKEPA